MQELKQLIILTGPPGSGKTTYAELLQRNHFDDYDGMLLPVYDCDLDNKDQWSLSSAKETILCTSAPSHANKAYWIQSATLAGFTPTLLVMWIPRMVANQRMMLRSGLSKTERNNLQESVQRWYKLYSRHPLEVRVKQ